MPKPLPQPTHPAVIEARRLRAEGKIDQAANLVADLVHRDPKNIDALCLMGALGMQTGAPDIAIMSLSRAATLSPKSANILFDLGNAHLLGSDPAQALIAFRQALELRPRDGALFRNLGQAQLDTGDTAMALKSFRKALSILPYDTYSAHMIAALSGEANATAASYVPNLFDHYAELFDQHLTGALDYRIPAAIRDMLAGHSPIAQLLDVGCGTGLVAEALRDQAPVMDGIDISPEMVRKAEARGLYRHLRTGDAAEVLVNDPSFAGPYDLVTAADVFIYIGALETIFALVAQRLAPGGRFVFSVETTDGPDLAIRSSGRFVHPHAYIVGLAAENGLAIVEHKSTAIRLEKNRPIPGALYLLAAS